MVVDPRESKQRKKEDYEKHGAELRKLKADPLGYLMSLEEFKQNPDSRLVKANAELDQLRAQIVKDDKTIFKLS